MKRMNLWASRMREKAIPLILDVGGAASPTNKGRAFPVNTSGFVSHRHLVPKGMWFTSDIIAGSGVDFVCNINNMGTITQRFDGIVCNFVLEHVADPQKAISEMARLLKPNGLLFLATHHSFPLHWYPSDYYRFSDQAICSLLHNAGLSVGYVGLYDRVQIVPLDPPEISALKHPVNAFACVSAIASKGEYKMRIGLDLDGTVYAHPAFFGAMIQAMAADGHTFFCTSSHGRDEWTTDCIRLESLGIDPTLISPVLMSAHRHGNIALKSQQASQLDAIFDDDFRVQVGTDTIQFCPLRGGNSHATNEGVMYR